MKRIGRGAILPTSPARFGGAEWFAKSAVPAVKTSDVGISARFELPGRARSSRSDLAPAPVGDDRALAGRLRRCLEERLAADGEAKASDAPRSTSRTSVQERRPRARGRDPPTNRERTSASALALPATVEQQDAVAVAREHPRRRSRAGTARSDDDRRTVARRHVTREGRARRVRNEPSSCGDAKRRLRDEARAECVNTRRAQVQDDEVDELLGANDGARRDRGTCRSSSSRATGARRSPARRREARPEIVAGRRSVEA